MNKPVRVAAADTVYARKERYSLVELERKESTGDDDLMYRVILRDDAALSTLYFRYGGQVKAFVRHLAPELPDAKIEEIVQDVFLLVYKKAASYEPRNKFKSWIFSMAALHTKSAKRRSWVREKLMITWGHELAEQSRTNRVPSQDSGLAAKKGLAKVIEAMPEKYKMVILLHAQGFTASEIGQIQDLRESTVWVRIHRGRKIIRESVGSLEELLCQTG